MEPHAIALEAMGLRRVALATYYKDELNQAIVDYFARFGIESELLPGFSATGQDEALYATPLLALDAVSWTDVYRHCKQGLERLGGSGYAHYINGGGREAAPAGGLLQRDPRGSVVRGLAAAM